MMRSIGTVRVAACLTAAALALLALPGCAASADRPAEPAAPSAAAGSRFPLAVTDDASRTVMLKAPAKRIVSLAPSNTEVVYSLGALSRLVGVTTFDDYPAQVSSIAKMGDFTTPNLEAIASVKPDLVLVTGGVQADVLGKLEGLGAAVLVIDPKDLDGVYRAIGLVGKALGAEAKATEVVDGMKAEVAGVKERIGSDPPVTCFVEIGWNPLFTAGKGTLVDDLVTRAGGTNVVTQPGYVGYSVEQLLKDQPRVYLGTKSSLGDPFTIDRRPGYKRLNAVISGRVFALDDNLVSRPGPRVVEGVAEIARLLHPDRF